MEPFPARSTQSACVTGRGNARLAKRLRAIEYSAIREAREDDGCNSTSSGAVFTFDQTGTGIPSTFELCVGVRERELRSWQCRG
jgi:hypothetical protein